MSLTQELHLAHKARQARIAQAALRRQAAADPVVERTEPPIFAEPAPTRPIADVVTRIDEVGDRLQIWLGAKTSTRILRVVADACDMTIKELLRIEGKGCRDAAHVNARCIVVGLCLELTPLSLNSIGRLLNGRDHTSIIHARNKCRTLRQDPEFNARYGQMRARVLGQ